MTDWARFWPVDLHVHTPGSSDTKPDGFGSAEDIVKAAMDAGLAAIAITDHNTAEWCDAVSEAAAGTPLIVLPGVEISTSEGHLLAIWEEGTPSTVINELLVRLNIGHDKRGKLDVAADAGFSAAAQQVAACKGVAIAAHIDRPKGLLSMAVRAQLQKTLMDEALDAVEVVRLETAEDVAQRINGKRTLACVRGSDTWDPTTSAHALSGIGARRTWIKGSRPDLLGIRHAFGDPDLRVALNEPVMKPTYPQLERVEITGGFLNGQRVMLCPDLNCLLGGTGAGKSLILEAVRYAMSQQLDRTKFGRLWEEVQSRLEFALTESGVVRLQLLAEGHRYRVERAFSRDGATRTTVLQEVQEDWVSVDVHPRDLISLAAFSQGEILEYSREPVGRMTLIDAGIDLSEHTSAIDQLTAELRRNAGALIAARHRVGALRRLANREAETSEQVRLLAGLFDSEIVKQQESWKKEDNALKRATKHLTGLQPPSLTSPRLPATAEVPTNADLFASAAKILDDLDKAVAAGVAAIEDAVNAASTSLRLTSEQWSGRFDGFRRDLDAELERVNPGASLAALRDRLEGLQAKLTEARAAKEELDNEAQPALAAVLAGRERLIEELSAARHRRRELRRTRVEALNAKTAGFVKLDIPSYGDYSDFRSALDKLKIGSRVRDDVLESIARTVHPLRFGRALWQANVNDLVNDEAGIDAASVARLLTNVADRDLWQTVLEVQVLDRPDVLIVKFRKPDDGNYALIEQLAHGQRCTAILVILLADGNTPVLLDQPEDALHAPWIEEYLVDRLRSLRGTRQYIFATRSPGIVVSGDAEQIITMKATAAGHGEVEASGSLERHDLNRLTLHHLEGGPVPFNRRTRKLHVSAHSAS